MIANINRYGIVNSVLTDSMEQSKWKIYRKATHTN